jgi:hypothetical protein
MNETTAKEKEYNYSLYYLLLFVLISLLSLFILFEFMDIILGNLNDGKLIALYNAVVNLVKKIQNNEHFFEKKFILSFSLLLLAMINVISESKINLKSNKKNGNLLMAFGLMVWSIVYFFDFKTMGFAGLILSIGLFLAYILLILRAGGIFNSLIALPKIDIFNHLNEQFPQNEKDIDSEVAIKYRTQYQLQNNWREGTITVVNPMRAVLTVGSQGSGKTFSVINPAIWQSINKGYCALIYDFKFPDLSLEAYNALINTLSTRTRIYENNGIPSFKILDFENLKYSDRCNPFSEKYMSTIDDCAQMSKNLMLNLNKSWIKKDGDFWAISAINLLTCVLWFLRVIERKSEHYRNYCSLPHAIELLNKDPKVLFQLIGQYPELDTYSSMFTIALNNQAGSQIAGQIASTQAALAALSSPNIYWVMSGNTMSLQINDPNHPQILCLGNNPTKSSVYGAALSVYTSTVMKNIYKSKELPSAFFIDELPSMYLMGLDDFIAHVRSYKVATWLGIQDFEQLTKSYGKEAADVIINTCGTVFAGQVNGQSAERLSKMFGESGQDNFGTSFTKGDTNINYSVNYRSMLPPSKIMTLSQGHFVGKTADNFDQIIERKLFNAYLHVDEKAMKKEYKVLPIKLEGDEAQINNKVQENYLRIKDEINRLLDDLAI